MRLQVKLVAVLTLVLGISMPAWAVEAIRGPYLQLGTPDSIIVRWTTDKLRQSKVRYGTTLGNLDQEVKVLGKRLLHEVELVNLSPDTRYYYAVLANQTLLAGDDADHFFDTAPVVGSAKPTRIWVLGDSGTADANAMAVRDAYYAYTAAQHTQLWLMLGDNAYPSGTDAEYQAALFDIFPEMLRKSVLWPAFGNHDAGSSDAISQFGPYFDIFTLPANAEAGGIVSGTEAYYSFDYANIHFVVLDSMDSSRTPTGPMLTWMANDVAATNQKWIVAFWHHPPYSKGSHDSDDSIVDARLVEMRENALPILEDYGVDLVLAGHSHSYERSFLIDGHYGLSESFGPEHTVDGGDGKETGDGAYVKPLVAQASHQGTVYTVAGSAGKLSGGALDHPVMVVTYNLLGSVVLDIDDDRLDARFLDWTGLVMDEYTIIKDEELVVDFAANPTSGSAPLEVDFTDLSVIEATEWAWDFNDDSIVDSTEQNPIHVYDQPGVYSVRLTIFSPQGQFEKLRLNYVDVSLVAPVAQFSASTLFGVAPLSVDFTDLSENLPDQWEWDFNDDGLVDSLDENPNHVYTGPGIYSVKLTAANSAGSDDELKTFYIVVVPDPPGKISGLVIGPGKSALSWDAHPDACYYDVVKGDLLQLRASGGDFSVSQLGCLVEDVVAPQSIDDEIPASGQGFFYLVRAVNCSEEAGTYDTIDQIKPRDPGLQGPGAACSCQPSDDLDGDGHCSVFDNCPDVFNTDQLDTDTDGFGDECDCDAFNAFCSTNCTDADGDEFCITSDCDDLSADTAPGAAPNDSLVACMKDFDGDGYGDIDPPSGVTGGTDCDDSDPGINPDTSWFVDEDGDQFGNALVTQVQCAAPEGYVADNTDCDDASAVTFPGAAPGDSTEACMKDGDDDDWADDDPPAGVAAGTDCDDGDADIHPDTMWHADTDDDGYGDELVALAQCMQPAGYILDSSDCDDVSPTAAVTFPGAAPKDSALACLKDVDGDGYGDQTPPEGVLAGTDCDDDDEAVNPETLWYSDADGDGYGESRSPLAQCTQPVDHVSDSTDCDDLSSTAADTYPGAADSDSSSECMKDVDGDDYGDENPPDGVVAGTDCNDADPDVYPGSGC